MKCYSEQLLALYVEGDLPTGGAVYDRALFQKIEDETEIARHVETCAACAEAVKKLRASQSILKSFREDSVTLDALVTVRSRVFESVERADRFSLWLNVERLLFTGFRRYALAGFAVAVMAGGLVWYSQPGVQPKRESVQTAIVTAPANDVTVGAERKVDSSAAPRPVKHVRRHASPPRDEPASVPAEEPQQIVMKIVTDDPNIVIYWLFDQKGASE